MQFTMLLNHNAYSQYTAEEWEKQVFIRNIKSFNKALGNDYHTDLDGPEDGLGYNEDLIKELKAFLAEYQAANPTEVIQPMKADYLAERSI